MSGRLPLLVLGVLSAFAGIATIAAAADNKDKSVAYRWIDEQGVVHYGDRIPPQYATKERAVLNSQGVEVRHMEAQRTPEQAAADARIHQDIMRQKQHDAFLLSSYTSVKDIEALRDLRLDQLQAQKSAAQQYVESLHGRLSTLQDRAKVFKPYNTRPGAHRLPDDVAEDLVHTLNELRTQSNIVANKNEEESTLKDQFQADIDRYVQLHATASHN
jgi:hypothetical protein